MISNGMGSGERAVANTLPLASSRGLQPHGRNLANNCRMFDAREWVAGIKPASRTKRQQIGAEGTRDGAACRIERRVGDRRLRARGLVDNAIGEAGTRMWQCVTRYVGCDAAVESVAETTTKDFTRDTKESPGRAAIASAARAVCVAPRPDAAPVDIAAVRGRGFIRTQRRRRALVRLATAFAGLVVVSGAIANPSAGDAAPPSSSAKASPSTSSPYHPDRFAGGAGTYYRLVWGVDSLSVKWTESGEVIRFSYRVLDPEKAAPLNEKRSAPSLIDPKAGVQLVVPSMEKIGQLRQSSAAEAGKSYWMAFSNSGRIVKRGDRVNVVIGPFRAEGLVVE